MCDTRPKREREGSQDDGERRGQCRQRCRRQESGTATTLRAVWEELSERVAQKAWTQEAALLEARATWLRRRLTSTPLQPREVFWSWVAKQRGEGRLKGLERRERGHSHLVVPHWQAQASLLLKEYDSDWQEGKEGPLEIRADLMERERLYERVLRAARTTATSFPTVDAACTQQVWQIMKKAFPGPTGWRRYHEVLAVLMLRRQLEGSLALPHVPGAQDWWTRAEDRVERVADHHRTPQYSPKQWRSALERGVVVDFGAGTQSMGPAATKAGLVYIPIDLVEWVWSATRGAWVQNLVADVAAWPTSKAHTEIRRLVKDKWQLDLGHDFATRGALLWMSMNCRSYSPLDASNRTRGCGYRDHSKPTRPPLRTKAGRVAAQEDVTMQQWIEVAKLWAAQGAHWVLENPVGSLARRPFMCTGRLGPAVVRQRVDYCAFGRRDKKPTHLWTTLTKWSPKGRSGNGCCGGVGRCWAMEGTRHTHTATGTSDKIRPSGRGSVAAKSAVPLELHSEIIAEWQGCRA